jgi:hypothetical protein
MERLIKVVKRYALRVELLQDPNTNWLPERRVNLQTQKKN